MKGNNLVGDAVSFLLLLRFQVGAARIPHVLLWWALAHMRSNCSWLPVAVELSGSLVSLKL